MIEEYKKQKIMINPGQFEVGAYGRYKFRGEILHQYDSFVHGDSEDEVLKKIKSFIDQDEFAAAVRTSKERK